MNSDLPPQAYAAALAFATAEPSDGTSGDQLRLPQKMNLPPICSN